MCILLYELRCGLLMKRVYIWYLLGSSLKYLWCFLYCQVVLLTSMYLFWLEPHWYVTWMWHWSILWTQPFFLTQSNLNVSLLSLDSCGHDDCLKILWNDWFIPDMFLQFIMCVGVSPISFKNPILSMSLYQSINNASLSIESWWSTGVNLSVFCMSTSCTISWSSKT